MKIRKKIFKKHFIFDLDGVLFDSLNNMKLSWNLVIKKNKLKITFSKYKKHIGLPFLQILKKLGIKQNQGKIKKEYFLYSKKNIHKITPYSNVKMTLKKLKKKGKKISIVTSKNRTNALILLKKLNIKFDYIKTESKTLKGKPHADMINYCVNKSNLQKDQCLYVGDMRVDLLTAKNAGIDFLLAKYGFNKEFKYHNYIKNISHIFKYYE